MKEMQRILVSALALVCWTSAGAAQDQPTASDRTAAWLIYQAVPGLSWTALPGETHMAFEWEAAPVLCTFGMTKLTSPWRFFFVEPPARFTGSIELVTAGRVFIHKVNDSHWGFSAGLVGHVPLIEYGEYLTFNPGIVRHWLGGRPSDFVAGGFSMLFGFIEYNVQYSPRGHIWVHQLAVRMF